MDSKKILIIAEKKSFAERLAEVIPGETKVGSGFFQKGKTYISWAAGHLLEALMPSDFENFTGWNWESIPFRPPNSRLYYKPADKTDFDKNVKQRQLKIIKNLYDNNDFDYIYNACDAEREGELIFWEIYEHTKMKTPVKRVWVTALEANVILDALENAKDDSFYKPKRDGAYARQYADWLLGLNLTIGFSAKTNSLVHIGRVQTPTLSLLVNRRLEIENFKPETYYELVVNFGDRYEGKWFKDQKGNTKVGGKEELAELAKRVEGKASIVTEKNVTKQRENPKGLFDLSDLQKEANRKFKYTATKTLDIAQLLYDKYRVISYPRTDSSYLMESQVPGLEKILNNIKDNDYREYAREVIDMGIPTNKSFVDDSKVSDHYAIVPTQTGYYKSDFDDEPKEGITKKDLSNIYDLILRRFLSVFYPAAEYERTEIITEVEGETFKTNGRVMTEEGWRKVYGVELDKEEEDEKALPPIEEGEENEVTEVKQEEKQTRPPSYHNDATLVAAMENARNLLDEEEKEQLRKSGSSMELGTVATRGNIMDNLERRGYTERKGTRIIATDKGVKLISIAPEDLKSPEITAQWEQKLKLIEQGQYNIDQFKDEIWEYVKDQVAEVRKSDINVTFSDSERGPKDTEKTCPRCNSSVLEWKNNYSCESHSKETPCFFIMKTVLKKKLTKTAIFKLLEEGKTPLIKGFTSKKGRKFNAYLVWKEDNKLGFELEDRMKESGEEVTCKKCGNIVKFYGRFYTCGTKNEDDKFCFSLPAKFAGKEITPEIVKILMNKGKTNVYNLTSKAGKKYKARFLYNIDQNEIKMEFEN